MSEILGAIEYLKRLLKANGIQYTAIAKSLKLSEASVKRLFSTKKFDLDRLGKICELAEISLVDLFTMSQKSQVLSQLTYDQEKAITSDLKLLLVATCVINRWRFAEILHHYQISKQECIKKLLFLDRIKIIELRPNNRFKLKISNNFSWLANGPVQAFFQKNLQEDFFSSQFSKEEEALILRFGRLTKESNMALKNKLLLFVKDFNNHCQEDSHQPLSKRHGSAIVIGIRPWIPAIFEKFKK